MPDVGDVVKNAEGEIGRVCCVKSADDTAGVQFQDGCRLVGLSSLTLAEGDAPICKAKCTKRCN